MEYIMTVTVLVSIWYLADKLQQILNILKRIERDMFDG